MFSGCFDVIIYPYLTTCWRFRSSFSHPYGCEAFPWNFLEGQSDIVSRKNCNTFTFVGCYAEFTHTFTPSVMRFLGFYGFRLRILTASKKSLSTDVIVICVVANHFINKLSKHHWSSLFASLPFTISTQGIGQALARLARAKAWTGRISSSETCSEQTSREGWAERVTVDLQKRSQTILLHDTFVTVLNFGRLFGNVGRMRKCDKLISACALVVGHVFDRFKDYWVRSEKDLFQR